MKLAKIRTVCKGALSDDPKVLTGITRGQEHRTSGLVLFFTEIAMLQATIWNK
jgi:hypothetical protein